jgi:alkanesulfonate monooxygenase SsuD/methylene tetrahydromethanopterin reductase-like flavin-dependent oxidoreductase (luciferase family)
MSGQAIRLAVALNGYGLTHRGPDGIEREVLPWHEIVLLTETAEETGYEAVFTPEIAAREAFATLSGLASATGELRLATGVVPLEARAPATLAMAAVTLQDISDGRFILGVGSREAIRSARDRLRALRELLAGGSDGDAGPLDIARPEGVDVPVYLAALGPRMTELAGEAADGVLLNWCTPERVAEARAQVARGAERAGRDPSGVTVCVYVRACLGHEEVHALAALGEAAAQYASMPKYRRQFDAMGLGSEADRAARASTGGPRSGVPVALLRNVCVWGTREEGLGRLEDYHRAGADLVVVYPVPVQEAVSSTMGTLLAAAPNPAVEG